MQGDPIKIEIYDKRRKMSTIIYVDKISENVFRAVENELFNCRLKYGTEFQTRINKEGKHEILRITKDSDFITKRFFLTSQFTEKEYRLWGDEIVKCGGFWQVDFGSMATVNLPKNCTLDLEEIFKTFNFNPTYIRED